MTDFTKEDLKLVVDDIMESIDDNIFYMSSNNKPDFITMLIESIKLRYGIK